jgi:hypothetical protein
MWIRIQKVDQCRSRSWSDFSNKVEFLHEDILTVGYRIGLKHTYGGTKAFMKVRNPVYLLSLVNFQAPGSALSSGTAILLTIFPGVPNALEKSPFMMKDVGDGLTKMIGLYLTTFSIDLGLNSRGGSFSIFLDCFLFLTNICGLCETRMA